jgi:hypothetical protein
MMIILMEVIARDQPTKVEILPTTMISVPLQEETVVRTLRIRTTYGNQS